jgi:glutaredoxin-like protein
MLGSTRPIISENDRIDLKRRFQKELKSGLTIRLFTQKASLLTIPGRPDCPYCPQTQQLMEEVVALSPKFKLETYDFYGQPDKAREHAIERIPAILLGKDGDANVRYYGIPSGYEFASFVDALTDLSRGVSHLSAETRKALKKVNQPVHIQVFVTPTCPNCPLVAGLAYSMAMENSLLRADVIEAQEFPALSQQYAVRSVPLTVINGTRRLMGAVSESALLAQITGVGIRELEEERQ